TVADLGGENRPQSVESLIRQCTIQFESLTQSTPPPGSPEARDKRRGRGKEDPTCRDQYAGLNPTHSHGSYLTQSVMSHASPGRSDLTVRPRRLSTRSAGRASKFPGQPAGHCRTRV